MLKISTQTDLRNAILLLEIRQAEEGKMLKAQYLVAYESIKPINLLKSTFIEATESDDLKDSLINATVGMSAGLLSKLLFQSVTNSPVKKIIGTAIMFGIKSLVARNPEFVKSMGAGVFEFIRNMLHNSEKKTETEEDAQPAAS